MILSQPFGCSIHITLVHAWYMRQNGHRASFSQSVRAPKRNQMEVKLGRPSKHCRLSTPWRKSHFHWANRDWDERRDVTRKDGDDVIVQQHTLIRDCLLQLLLSRLLRTLLLGAPTRWGFGKTSFVLKRGKGGGAMEGARDWC